ncbi:phage protein Gp36 family protein [Campylobacter sp. US33a]|uniref:phage protein Gp36 family protein n=1 Tax=Campylobacter sp. US33a TaxID=2498120 RepID=UPI001419CC29|nr:phage protein Gp36 family protein [Campylobacter sp. US33a]
MKNAKAFLINEQDLTKELSFNDIAQLSDLNADGVCDKEVIDDAISDAQNYIASFIKIPKNPTPLLKDICVKLAIVELKKRNDFPKDALNEIIQWAQDLLLKMANKKIPSEISEDENEPSIRVRAFKIKRKRMDLRRING